VDTLEGLGVEAILYQGHTWGGCDIALHEARVLGIKHIIHVGHHGPVRVKIPDDIKVLFIPAFSNLSVEKCVYNAIQPLSGYRKIGLLTSIQHYRELNKAKSILEGEGFTVEIGCSKSMPRGLVIGCDLTTALSIRDEVEAYLVISGGVFHPLGVAIATEKPVIRADPYTGKAENIAREAEKVIRLRLSSIVKAIDAENFAILVSTKPGQYLLSKAIEIKKRLTDNGKKASILLLNDIDPLQLENFPQFEAYINTACPRVPIDDYQLFHKPIINLHEVEYIIREKIEDYIGYKSIKYP